MGIIQEKQDLTYLNWSHLRSSGGTAGTYLKSESIMDGKKTYYKLSDFDPVRGVVGHECINEIIVDRLLTVLGVQHLSYDLIHADIEVDGREYETYLCASEDFKERGESKIALDDFFRINCEKGESAYDFCARNGWGKTIDQMLAVDYLILNRDRRGTNIEILRNSRAHAIRIAPLFDHGLSLLCTCRSEEEASKFDVLADRPCGNFIGGRSCSENLKLIRDRNVFAGKLEEQDRGRIFEGVIEILSPVFIEKIWEMIYRRYLIYENL